MGEGERAARLCAVSEALREWMGYRRDSADERVIAPLMARARSDLGESAFASAYAAGRALSYEDALAEARAWLTEGAPRTGGK